MYQIDRNGLGLNQVTFVKPIGEEKKSAKVTVYGKGVIDQIALAILRILGCFFKDLKPVRFKMSYQPKDNYLFPEDMYVTRKSLKTLLNVEVHAWMGSKNGVELIDKTQKEAINYVVNTLEVESQENDVNFFFQGYLEILNSRLKGILNRRINAYEMFISEQLAQMKTLEGQFQIPINIQTGELMHPDRRNSDACYLAHISIEYNKDTNKREALFLKDLETPEPSFTPEAEYVLKAGNQQLKQFIQLPINLKQVAHKLENEIFKREYSNLDEIPLVDHSEESKVTLTLAEGVREDYNLANHITLGDKKYLAMAYPLMDEQWKFWQMLFENKSPVIVKLANPPPKTPNYWPSAENPFIFEAPGGEIIVKLVKERHKADYLIKREFEITINGSSHRVTHLDFTSWPDKTVPNEEQLEHLLGEVRQTCENLEKEKSGPTQENTKKADDAEVLDQKDKTEKSDSNSSKEEVAKEPLGPITVHCMGGKGRTGTFIAIHSMLDCQKPDYIKTIFEMRKQRASNMVETVSQFQFIKNFRKSAEPKD